MRPGDQQEPNQSLSLFKAIMLAIFLAIVCAVLSTSLPLSFAQSDLQVTFIDVGQGDAAWLKTPDGLDILIDGGKQAQGPDLVSYLQGQGVTDIEVMVLSHPHADHVGGLVTVLQDMDVDAAVTNCQDHTSDVYQTFKDLLTSKGIPTTCVQDGDTFTWGVYISAAAVNPPEPLMSGTASDANNNSVVLRISSGTVDLLFTGDVQSEAEAAILGRGPTLEAEVLKVARHGSNSSSTAAFLSQVDPEVAIISVGTSNPYGHPSAEAIQRLRDADATIYRTDLNGTIVITTDGMRYSLQVEDVAIGTETAPPTTTDIATGTPSPWRNLAFWQTAAELVVCLGTVLAALLSLIAALVTLRRRKRSSSTEEDN
jgi:competence protein ComEC